MKRPFENVREIALTVAVWDMASRWNASDPVAALRYWLTDGVPGSALTGIRRVFAEKYRGLA